MTSNPESLKSQIPERYQDLKLIGQGGYGVVFKAKDTTLDKYVAIKMLTSELNSSQATRFQKEAQVLAKLDHPNILTALDFRVTESNSLLLVLDFIDGIDLKEYIEKNGPMTLEQAMPLFTSIISGLHYAHLNQVIHRDIKPSNVMLERGKNKSFSAKIVDFGISKWQPKDQKLTSSGSVAGSPLYMSPEQAKGQKVGIASDMYSLGCLFYFVLTGYAPIVGENPMITVTKKLSNKAPSLKEKLENGEFPDELEDIVAKMLKINPTERFSSLDELQNSLNQIEFKPSLNIVSGESNTKSSAELKTENPIQYKFRLKVILTLVAILIGVSALLVSNISNSTIESAAPPKKRIYVESDYTKDSKAVKAKKWVRSRPSPNNIKVYSHGKIQDEDLKEFQEQGSKITQLFISNSNFTGKGLTYLVNTGVMRIDIANCNLENDQMKKFSKLKDINRIGITKVSTLDEVGIKNLASCKSLTSLKLKQQKLSKADLEAVSNLTSISALDLRFSSFSSPSDLELLSKMQSLRYLTIGGYNFSDKHFMALSKLKNVGTLRIQTISKKSLKNGVPKLANLNHLEVIHFDKVKDFPSNIAESLAAINSLKVLSFASCPGITRQTTKGLSNIKNLEQVSIIDMDLESKMGCIYDLAKIPRLKGLKLDLSAKPAALIIQEKYPDLQIELVKPE